MTDAATGFGSAEWGHRAVLFSDDDELADVLVPAIEAAAAEGSPVLAALPPVRLAWLRHAIGPLAAPVALNGDVRPWRLGPTFGAVLRALRAADADAGPLVVAERPPTLRYAWQQRSYLRHEAAASALFAGENGTVLCLYDEGVYADDVLAGALATHASIHRRRGVERSAAFVEPVAYLDAAARREEPDAAPASGSSTPRDAVATRASSRAPAWWLPLTGARALPAVRATLRAHADVAGVPPPVAEELALAVTELATNALVHGCPPRHVRGEVAEGALVCAVRDGGPGPPDVMAGYRLPDPAGHSGRGIWLASQLCDAVEVARGAGGSEVRAYTRLADPAPRPHGRPPTSGC